MMSLRKDNSKTSLSHKKARQWIEVVADGFLLPDQQTLLEQHLMHCEVCQTFASQLERFEERLQISLKGRWAQTRSYNLTSAIADVERRSRRAAIIRAVSTTGKTLLQLSAVAILFLAIVFVTTPTTTLAPTATAAPTIQPGDTERKLMVNDLERSYLLHIPPGLNSQQPLPVVFAFHGSWGTPRGMRLVSGFNDIADLANFLVVYPEGVFRTWNAGICCGNAMRHNVDELAFIRQMLSDLDTIASIDAKRIYAVGTNNGAALVYRLACEMSENFAAIAAVAGAADYSPCQPQQAISVIHVHGLADGIWPYAGGTSADFPPVEEVIATWVKLAGCTGSAQVEKLDNITTHISYASCQAGTAVELYTIDSLYHGWPAKDDLPTSEIIWDFFAAHPKP